MQGLPILKPPYGVLNAINLDKGEITWQVPHGDTPDAVRNSPALRGMTIPKTGQQGSVGLLVTKTLVVLGDPQMTTTPEHPRGAMLRAYDKTNGKEVGAVLDAGAAKRLADVLHGAGWPPGRRRSPSAEVPTRARSSAFALPGSWVRLVDATAGEGGRTSST